MSELFGKIDLIKFRGSNFMSITKTNISIMFLTICIGLIAVFGWLCYQKTHEVHIISPDYRWESVIFKEINQATELSDLTELRKTSVGDGNIEIRVWRGFGGSPLEGVVLRRENGQWSGLHLVADNYPIDENVEVTELDSPKSGWKSFWQQINDQKILTLPQSTDEGCVNSQIDGISYVIEINQDNIYRTYEHPDSDKCQEAKQTKKIGQIIGLEFDSGSEKCQTAEWFPCMTLLKSLNELD